MEPDKLYLTANSVHSIGTSRYCMTQILLAKMTLVY
jgi:hypothetical protein